MHPRAALATLLLASFLLLPSMASIGMFFDGMIYASISRNLAEGTGSWWAPHFSEGLFPFFFEHPPFMFWVQSAWFRVLGDSYLTERAHDLALVVLSAVLMVLLWRRICRVASMPELCPWWWLPLLLWVLVPKWSWSYRNNMLENTLTLLCLVVIWLLIPALTAAGGLRRAVALALAGALTVLAILTKGPVALFVLPAPAILGLALSCRWQRVAATTLLLTLIVAIGLGLVLSIPDARALLQTYWLHQISTRTGLSAVSGRMVLELGQKLVPMLMLLAAAWWWTDARHRKINDKVLSMSAALLAVGLSASLPLALGDLASAHYLVPALPYFALGFALPIAWSIEYSIHDRGARARVWLHARSGLAFRIASALVTGTVLAMCISRVGEIRKDVEHHRFFDQVVGATGAGQVVGIDESLYDDWSLHAVGQRHHRISLRTDLDAPRFLIAPAGRLDVGEEYRAVAGAGTPWVWVLLLRK